jgi:hypothetical protein
MNRRTKTITALVVAGSLAAVAGIAMGAGRDDAEAPIRGDALDRASAAALAHTGGGRVTDTEVGDEEGYYEVEVTLDGGSQVDVHLDRDFNVIGQETEGSEGGDEE